jgi:hypothetical protein
MTTAKQLIRRNRRLAVQRWGTRVTRTAFEALRAYSEQSQFSLASGDLLLLDNGWYVTNAGLTRLARRNRCAGIDVKPVQAFCDPVGRRWAFQATVYKSRVCRGFVGYGDADPSNVSPLVCGAEMRVAETRAVNRAIRKAYGIGLCSIEELQAVHTSNEPARLPTQPAGGSGSGGRRVRDHLCQIIREHQLDPNLVKAYAADFCGVKTLKDATREQVETFVNELSEWAERDRNALLCQLNSYLGGKEGAA